MAYRKRSGRRASASGRDYFWATPVQRVGALDANDKYPWNVARPGWTGIATNQSNPTNLTNDLSYATSRHGATTVRWDDAYEFRPRDRTWKVHYFQGQVILGHHGSSVADFYGAGRLSMGAGLAMPRAEGSGVPSDLLTPEGRRIETHYLAIIVGQADTGGAVMDRQRHVAMKVGKTLAPDQDWYINFEWDHREGSLQGAPQILVHGRFRCSRA